MKLVALKPMRYAGRALVVDDEFEAGDKDGKLLVRIRKARDATPAPRARSPASPSIPKAEPAAERAVPRYSRRDMQADKD